LGGREGQIASEVGGGSVERKSGLNGQYKKKKKNYRRPLRREKHSYELEKNINKKETGGRRKKKGGGQKRKRNPGGA